MKYIARVVLQVTAVISGAILLAACVTMNRLDEFRFEDRTVAAIILSPPRAEVFTISAFWIDTQDPVGSALRIGSGLIKEAEARMAQERMERALETVDLAEIIRARTLQAGAEVLRCRTIDDADQADFLFDIEIREYGIDAQSGEAGLSFRMNVQVVLFSTKERSMVWRRQIRENVPISPAVFGMGESAGNVMTVLVLSQLTEEKMAKGFENLAQEAGDCIASRLHKDFVKARYQ